MRTSSECSGKIDSMGGENMSGIILFDGVCNLCSGLVQFIIKRDPHGYFQFASLQSSLAQKLLMRYGVDLETDSFVYIENDACYTKSSAALRVCRHLRGLWRCFFAGILLPPVLRDILYDFIAKRRYRWFGKQDSCMLPFPGDQHRFLRADDEAK